ncbi:outer membrane protein assembly factor BamB family protein [Actinokineospora diospyrosa]|uniref:outer membrane protein assembly factor BamB family protein n=1 Tax=Actinokineospora diospyrosa TaxID=103728 RepID=UPI0020A37AFC|nr:PQQ-binding-like beta-propeller repeat protein [Actinokineospora diospyrosa]
MDWERPLHQRTYTAWAAAGPDGLVVHERRTRLVSVSSDDGSTRWDIPDVLYPRNVTVSDGRCLVQPQNHDELRCLDVRTGEHLWSANTHSSTGHLVVVGTTVLVGGQYTPLRAVDIATGDIRWARDDLTKIVRPAAGASGLLIGKPNCPSVQLIDLGDGRDLGDVPLPCPIPQDGYFAGITALDADRFAIRCGPRSVAEVVPSTGTARVIVHAERDLADTPPVYVGGRLWLREVSGGLLVRGPDGCTRGTGIRQDVVNEVIPVDDGFVVAGRHGSFIRLDADGRWVGRVVVAQRIGGVRWLDADRVVVVTKGSLRAITLSTLPWVRRRR